MQSAQSRPEGSQLLVDSIPQSDEKAQSRSQQTDAAAPSRKAAAQFLANWRVFPKSLVAVMLIWIFSWLYFGTAWGIEVPDYSRQPVLCMLWACHESLLVTLQYSVISSVSVIYADSPHMPALCKTNLALYKSFCSWLQNSFHSQT